MEQTARNRNYRLVIRGVARIFPEVHTVFQTNLVLFLFNFDIFPGMHTHAYCRTGSYVPS